MPNPSRMPPGLSGSAAALASLAAFTAAASLPGLAQWGALLLGVLLLEHTAAHCIREQRTWSRLRERASILICSERRRGPGYRLHAQEKVFLSLIVARSTVRYRVAPSGAPFARRSDPFLRVAWVKLGGWPDYGGTKSATMANAPVSNARKDEKA